MSFDNDESFGDQIASEGYQSLESKVSYEESENEKKSQGSDFSDQEKQNSKLALDNIEVDDDYFEENNDFFQEEIPEWRQKYDFSKTKAPNIRRVHQLEGEQRLTFNIINKLEFVKMIGLRAKQISQSSTLYVNMNQKDFEKPNVIEMAKREFLAKSVPFVIEREHPSGEFQRWSLQELNQ